MSFPYDLIEPPHYLSYGVLYADGLTSRIYVHQRRRNHEGRTHGDT